MRKLRNPWPDLLRPPHPNKGKRLRPRPEKPGPHPIARHGSLLILEVRDERGRKALRYVRDAA
jgi:hypothetical protein